MSFNKLFFNLLLLGICSLLFSCNSSDSKELDKNIQELNIYYFQYSFSNDSLNELQEKINLSKYKLDERVQQLAFIVSLDLKDYSEALKIAQTKYQNDDTHTFQSLIVLGILTEIVIDHSNSIQYYDLAKAKLIPNGGNSDIEQFYIKLADWLILNNSDSYQSITELETNTTFIKSEIEIIKQSTREEYLLKYLGKVT